MVDWRTLKKIDAHILNQMDFTQAEAEMIAYGNIEKILYKE